MMTRLDSIPHRICAGAPEPRGGCALRAAGRLTGRALDIYWIDVEGGGATLIVSPSGESLLVDTGWRKDDRDARRIHDVATKVPG